jgi:hypothetical protein
MTAAAAGKRLLRNMMRLLLPGGPETPPVDR